MIHNKDYSNSKFIVAKQGILHVRLGMVQYHLHVQYFACAKQFARVPAHT